MQPEIRKFVTYDEEVLVEGFRPADPPWRMFAVAAIVTNPWAGRYVEDLKPEIQVYGPILGKMISDRMIALAGSSNAIEAYGKAAVVGLNGEVEHASGLIHTLRFGNHYRQAVGAKSYLAFTNTRGPANAPIMVPLMDKNDVGRRSHYLTIQFSISDAPRDDEIVIVLGAATSGRPHHRIGDRYQDLQELDHDVDNPAAL
ncbi:MULTISPECIES: amino acid synthesis family protein [unclassified Ruegeria]|uniref:amino acid synthesis family protein n=1 Tax=unclassified Ruegeria TaxID=2625375 RepID=UPI001487E477|nr:MULTISPECIES: amino acid synthesis family protein [unclassified Ruegeria]NOD75614.1 amino acid synthesis family protein [Ruegeria sp. HKCCD4332]NOD90980.1 amino acid synthesis family protein [Ruegeria sp. HKCCD4318]NOD93182.1 amino acid synthesis family protein [Ruegeria sp. HKCCD4884]NOE16358.1 amino acid synthesis family protein [Ruegeria sp. HKCCD4318-2]NOG10149.1 amino acid synthesis family protein [Ruegeria sp. HKCCD4315]